ncbi:MAG: hypothetical protein AAGF54_16865, partial [Pseudomonadota bacterium]
LFLRYLPINDEGEKVEWVGELFELIAHEVTTNLTKHAECVDDSYEVKWGVGKCPRSNCFMFIVENQIRTDNENKSLSGAIELETDYEKFRYSTGLGQFRVAISQLVDIPDIRVSVLESNGAHFYQLAIPLGCFVEDSA